MIKAYHQLGRYGMTKKALRALWEEVTEAGVIVPATARLERDKMDARCYRHIRSSIRAKYLKANPKAWKAMVQMIDSVLKRMPQKGHRQTRFECEDVMAGDLDRVFLGLRWYGDLIYDHKTDTSEYFRNGFVFDAEDLLRRGARFRTEDLLSRYADAIKETTKQDYKTVAQAKKALTGELGDIIETRSLTGQEGIDDMLECIEGVGDFDRPEGGECPGEIVWEGALPLELAVQGWREGKRIW